AMSSGEHFGLFSVRERLNMIGGRMHIESTPRQGTRVTLTVPMTLPPAAEEPQHNATVPHELGASPADQADRRIGVLIVDDHEILREGLCSMLRDEAD